MYVPAAERARKRAYIQVYACYVCYGYITAEACTHTHSGRAARAGGVRCTVFFRCTAVRILSYIACCVLLESNKPSSTLHTR